MMTGEVMVVVDRGADAQPARRRSKNAELFAAAMMRLLGFAAAAVCMLENGRSSRP